MIWLKEEAASGHRACAAARYDCEYVAAAGDAFCCSACRAQVYWAEATCQELDMPDLPPYDLLGHGLDSARARSVMWPRSAELPPGATAPLHSENCARCPGGAGCFSHALATSTRNSANWCAEVQALHSAGDVPPPPPLQGGAPPPPSAAYANHRICLFWKKGECSRGALCTFAHGEGDLLSRRQFKTRLCQWFMREGKCYYEESCNFAHGQQELR